MTNRLNLSIVTIEFPRGLCWKDTAIVTTGFSDSARRLLLALAVACVPLAPALAQEDPPNNVSGVTVKRMHKDEQAFFKMDAAGFARATPQQVWQVLTDYESLPQFVPNLSSSKIVSRSEKEIILEQNGKAGFLFLTRNVHITVRVVEQPFSAVDIALVKGDMKHYMARWEFAPFTQNGISGTRIIYAATMEPDFFVPPLIASSLVQEDVRRTMEAVIAEIARRFQVPPQNKL